MHDAGTSCLAKLQIRTPSTPRRINLSIPAFVPRTDATSLLSAQSLCSPMSAFGGKATSRGRTSMSASLIGRLRSSAFRLSTAAVSTSLAGSCFSTDSAHRPVQHGDSRTRWSNLMGGLTVKRTIGPSGHANSPHPSSREGHHSTTWWSSSYSLLGSIRCHTAVTTSLVQRNSVPSTQMRCMITANRRARATIAFFIPRRLAICIAQALSHDHFFERSMLCAAS